MHNIISYFFSFDFSVNISEGFTDSPGFDFFGDDDGRNGFAG